jgi:hypothetical protein
MSGAVSLERLENNIKILKDKAAKAAKASKNPNDFRIIVLLYPGRYSNSNQEKEEEVIAGFPSPALSMKWVAICRKSKRWE